jgi:formamidopyrimidine-DNA glycosylase
MPEMIEIEFYRRTADRAQGRRVRTVQAPDPWFLKGGLDAETVITALRGRTISGSRRIGKLLLLDTDGPTLGLRFGMTGRIVVDGAGPIEELEYGSRRDLPEWDRFGLTFDDGGQLRINDPRRLGGVSLDPDVTLLGPDALAITRGRLAAVLAGSRAPLKACLLDQGRVAGLGNLLVDEILYRAGFDPARPAGGLGHAQVTRLHRFVRSTVNDLLSRGGSHRGRLQAARVRGGTCPRDGALLARRTIGGRTTYSCPRHQR